MSATSLDTQLFSTTFYQPWWVTLLRGTILLIFGVFATVWPTQTVVFLVRLLGVYFIVDGIFILFMSIGNKKHDIRWKATLARGIVGIIIGAFILFAPSFTAATIGVVLVYILAALSFFHGVMDVIKAFRANRETKNEWSIVLSGAFFIILAILLVVSPLQFGKAFLRIIGIFSLVAAAAMLYSGFQQRHKLR